MPNDPDLLNLSPPGMTGWLPELENSDPAQAPSQIAVRLVASGDRVVISVSAADGSDAEALLRKLGIKPEAIRHLLCG